MTDDLPDHIKEQFARLSAFQEAHAPRCAVCKKKIVYGEGPLDSYVMEVKGKKQSVCSDCYYESLGRLVEEHPIVSPRRRA